LKRLSIKLLLFLPILIFIGALNYFVDPSHVFERESYAKGIAEVLLSGRNVANAGNHDDRLVQKFYVQGLKEAPEVLVFGSSRAMYVRSALFPGHTFFNSHVSAGTLEDYIAIYAIYRAANRKPRMVVLVADPSIVSDASAEGAPRIASSIEPYYWGIAEQLGELPPSVKPATAASYIEYLSTLVSLPYFQESFKYWVKRSRNTYYATSTIPEEHFVQFVDGSALRDRQGRSLAEFEAKGKAIRQARTLTPYRVTREKGDFLERFFVLLLADGVEPVLLLAPYHPAAFRSERLKSSLTKAQGFLSGLALRHGIPVVGSFDPTACEVTEADFEDISHLRPAGVERLFRGKQVIAGTAVTKP
jgi:hypothetical protein